MTYDRNDLPELTEDRRTAIHEAGHALVAHATKAFRIWAISVVDGEERGFVQPVDSSEDPDAVRRCADREARKARATANARTSLAGPVAGDLADWDGGDYLATQGIEAMPDILMAEDYLHIIHPRTGSKSLGAHRDREAKWVNKFLRANWAQLETVASELLKCKYMRGDTFEALMATLPPVVTP